MGIDEDLSRFFSLPPIDVELLRAQLGFLPEDVARMMAENNGAVHPFFRVLPMGFSWAFHMAHQAHCELGRRTLPGVPLLQDQRPAPQLGRGHGHHRSSMLIYADNNNHLGIDKHGLDVEQQVMMDKLHHYNLDTHDITNGSMLAESLGVRIDGLNGMVQPTPHRDWRLDRALRALECRPKISGEQLQVVVGHMTVRALLHRGLMGILRRAYVYIESSYSRKQRLWKSVADEIEMFRCLMPLANANIRAEWDGEPLCTDASLSGYAVMVGDHSSAEVAAHGRNDERWRFKRQEGRAFAPRARALDSANVFDDPLTVKPDVEGEVPAPWVLDESFPEIAPNLVDETRWKKLWNSRIAFKEPIHNIEARSVLAAVKHRARDSRRRGKRFLVLNDNMGVVLSVQKGRASNYGLLRIIRRISAHLLATGLRLSCRWLPSEWNAADEESRRWEVERKQREAREETSRGVHKKSRGRQQQKNEESLAGQGSEQDQETQSLRIEAAGSSESSPSGPWAEDNVEECREEEAACKSQTDRRSTVRS